MSWEPSPLDLDSGLPHLPSIHLLAHGAAQGISPSCAVCPAWTSASSMAGLRVGAAPVWCGCPHSDRDLEWQGLWGPWVG